MSPMASRTSVRARPVRSVPAGARRRRSRGAQDLLAAIVLCAALGSCRRGCDCPIPARPREAALLAAPATLYVVEGAEFILRARHVGADGGVLPITGNALTWEPGSADAFARGTAGGDSIILTAKPVEKVTETTVSVTMSESLAAEVAVFVVPADAIDAAGDKLVATAERYPNYALIDGNAKIDGGSAEAIASDAAPAICRKNSWIAFVGVGLAGELVGDCDPMPARPDVTGKVTVFAPTYGVFRKDVAWSTDNNTVTVSSPASGGFVAIERPAAIRVSYTVWIAAAGGIDSQVNEEMKLAREIFRREVTGLDLVGTIATAPTPAASAIVASRNTPLECASVRADLSAVPATFNGSTLNVVYVDDILAPAFGAGETSYPSGLRGYSCPPSEEHGAIILISWAAGLATTLAHELGHTLGLRDDAGHTNDREGFGYTNMMWGGESIDRALARAYFTPGQAFRMNFDTNSWLHRTTDAAAPRPKPEQTCGPPEAGLPCPPLAWDIAGPPAP